ncbi:hypothetical protein [Bradyrhizobium sp.]|uniref:hypothetical protein n=1 Tax=Bradyrhizobium sp. TaxID=376 RepID=UPI0029103793|nr:hypothetical protein [Bradyrhizobium sp.]MDU6140753.1 hypothetical protein [Bradyrhizobium sp.]
MNKILLVDDDRELTSLLKELLEMEGFNIVVAHDGERGGGGFTGGRFETIEGTDGFWCRGRHVLFSVAVLTHLVGPRLNEWLTVRNAAVGFCLGCRFAAVTRITVQSARRRGRRVATKTWRNLGSRWSYGCFAAGRELKTSCCARELR